MARKMKNSGIEWIGEIPEDWEVVKNKYVFKRLKELVNNEWKSTQLLSLTTRGIIKKDINNLEGKLPESFSTYQLIDKGDLVLCLFDLDISAVFNGLSPYYGMISPAYKRYVLKISGDIRYYNYLFAYVFSGRKYKNYSTTLRFTLDNQEFDRIATIKPSFREQTKIADFLDKKTNQIEQIKTAVKKEIQTLEDYKKSVITEAVTKGLDKNAAMKDSGIEWIGKIPKKSKLSKLKYLVSSNITDGTHQTPEYEDKENGYPFLSSKDITKGYIDWTDIKYVTKAVHEKLQKETQVRRGDILLAKNGTTGIAAIVDTDKVFDIYVTLALIRSDEKKVIPEYLLYAINSLLSKKQFDEYLLGIGVPNLHLNLIKNTYIIVHDLKYQNQIVEYLDKKCTLIDDAIAGKQKQLETLEECKKSLIYEYVTGKKEATEC